MAEFDDDTTALETRRDESKIATPASIPMSEMQLRIAQENPRDEARIWKGAIAELELMPDYADEAYYSIPYKDKSSGVEKIVQVEGLSIKAAMSLARRWGNCANGARVSDDREDRVICQGMFFDYETNVLTMRDISVSKFIIRKDKSRQRLDANRLNMAILSGESKAVRNAILSTLPAPLKDAYFQTARRLVINPPPKAGQKSESIDERIVKGKGVLVSKFGATKEEVDKLISDWVADADGNLGNEEILSRLIGLKNAIKDGAVKVADVMGRAEKESTPMPKEKAAASGPAQTPAP